MPLFDQSGMPFDKCLPLDAAQIDPPVADDCAECPIHSNRFPYPTCRNAVLIINRGALGIISLNSEDFRTSVLPENKEDREQAQAALRRYGVMKGQYKYIVTGLKAAFVQISANMKDMNLTEVQRNAKKEIADAYQVPYVLIDTEGTTYANLTAAEVKLYNDAIKPDAERISEVLNAAHGFDGFRIVPYFDHLSIFQEAKRLYADSAVTAASNAIASGLITEQQGKNIIANILE